MSQAARLSLLSLLATLDAVADRCQAAFDDACAEAYARPNRPADHLDALYDAAQSSAFAAKHLRAAL